MAVHHRDSPAHKLFSDSPKDWGSIWPPGDEAEGKTWCSFLINRQFFSSWQKCEQQVEWVQWRGFICYLSLITHICILSAIVSRLRELASNTGILEFYNFTGRREAFSFAPKSVIPFSIGNCWNFEVSHSGTNFIPIQVGNVWFGCVNGTN